MGCLIQNVSVFIHPLTDRPLFIFGGGVWNGLAWYGWWRGMEQGTRGMVCYGTMGILHGTGGWTGCSLRTAVTLWLSPSMQLFFGWWASLSVQPSWLSWCYKVKETWISQPVGAGRASSLLLINEQAFWDSILHLVSWSEVKVISIGCGLGHVWPSSLVNIEPGKHWAFSFGQCCREEKCLIVSDLKYLHPWSKTKRERKNESGVLVGSDGDPDCCLGGAPCQGARGLRGPWTLDRSGSGKPFQGLGAWGELWQCGGQVKSWWV